MAFLLYNYSHFILSKQAISILKNHCCVAGLKAYLPLFNSTAFSKIVCPLHSYWVGKLIKDFVLSILLETSFFL